MKGMNFYYVDKAWGEILRKLKLFRKGVNVLEGSGKKLSGKWKFDMRFLVTKRKVRKEMEELEKILQKV